MNRSKNKRKSEMWVSNNRVLLGSAKKDPGRNPNFDTEETKLLISLWGDPQIQRTLMTTHRKHIVIAKLAEKMCEFGYSRSPEEINTRIKNLKCFYNRLKKDIELGINHGSTWKHFDAMDEVMTRSIFSVRPNEIPKPSLKYQLELEQSEQEERKKLKLAKVEKENTVRTTGDFDGEIITQAHRNDDNTPMDCMDNDDENLLKIKEEDESENEVVETPLIIPKEEPMDDDFEFQSPVNEL